jgi:hypothetical protein
MSVLLQPILDLIYKLWDYVFGLPTTKWGTVTQTTPLLVQLDGDIDGNGAPVTVAPQTLVKTIPVGARVFCVEQQRRVTVIGVAEA